MTFSKPNTFAPIHTRGGFTKGVDLTSEMARELWIAREILSIGPEDRLRTASGTFVSMDRNWTTYCKDIGSSRQVVIGGRNCEQGNAVF